MLRLLRFSLWVFIFLNLADAASAQEPIFTTVCSIWKEPEAFAGKLVKLRATVRTSMETASIVEPDQSCERGLWFDYAREKDDGSKDLDERDSALQRKLPIYLNKDEGFRKFEEASGAHVYSREEGSICIGCSLYTVTATMIGRVDYAGKNGRGFGHLNIARLRFVMASVSDTSTVENKYDWSKWSRSPIRFPHGTIEGKLTDAEGHPIYLGEVEAIPPSGKVAIINPKASTEKDGSYSLDVKPGKYLLVVNRDSPATKNVPMDTTYYPSADRREAAQIVSVADGQTVTSIDIHPLRPLTEKHLRVRVVWPNGKPVEDANVSLAETSNTYAIAGDDDGGVSHTGSDGFVTLLAFARHSYRIEADIYKKPGYVPYCEDVFLLPADFRDGLEVTMVLRRQSETCRGQWDEEAKPLPAAK